MGKYEHIVFRNAPITEAVLDIRVQPSKGITIEALEKIHELIKDKYPDKQKQELFEAGFQFSPEGPVSLPGTSKPNGFLFRNNISKKIFQARLDGFSFNKLKPYENWEVFRDEAKEMWKIYAETAKPETILRIALRYINQLELPFPIENFDQYILTGPQSSPSLNLVVEHYFMRLVVINEAFDAKAIINETIKPITLNQKLPLIFDIDTFHERIYDINDIRIWEKFESLRDFKNEIFFRSLTDKAKELFK